MALGEGYDMVVLLSSDLIKWFRQIIFSGAESERVAVICRRGRDHITYYPFWVLTPVIAGIMPVHFCTVVI